MSANRPIGVVPQAAENNKRLFRRYAKVISQEDGSDSDAYILHILKLAAWLNSEKAYYSDARPEILRLLLLASLTLRRSLGIAEDIRVPFSVSAYPGNPMVHAYTTLIKSVKPFLNHFEERYRETMNFLMATTSGNVDPTPVLSSQVQYALINAFIPNSDMRNSEIPDKGNVVKMDPEEAGITEVSSAISFLSSQTTEAEAGHLLPGRTNKSITLSASLGKTKVKKKKNIDFNLLVQHDIKGLLEKKRSHSVKPGDAEPSDSVSILAHITPTPDDKTSLGPIGISTKTGNDGWDLPVNNASQEDINVASAKVTLPKAAVDQSIIQQPETIASSENAEYVMDVEQTPKSVLIDQMVPNTHARDEVAGQASLIEESIDDGRGKNLAIQRRLDDPPISEEMGNSGTFSDARVSIPMDVDSTDMHSEKVGPTNSLETVVTNVIHSDPIRLSREPGLDQSDQGIDQMNGKFGTEMRVVARQQGLKENSRISVQFEIPETQYRSVLNWINPSRDVASSICLTLGCYLTSDLIESAKRTGCMTFEAQVSSTRSTWPEYGGLVMNANFNNSREDFPLSPPFKVTPENLVDVSPFLVMGNNVIELNQRQDLSQYTFVLHAHFPTQAQLKQIEICKQKDKEWNDWLDHISRPLKIPLKTFDATSSQLTELHERFIVV